MIQDGIIQQTALLSPLKGASCIAPDSQSKKKNLAATVILTSLVDAFSILVIYLLVNFSNSGEMLYMSKNMELPSAMQTRILERNTLVKYEKGKLFIEEKEIANEELVSRLIEVRKTLAQRLGESFEGALTVQADRRVHFKDLNQIVLASSQAGFNDIKFAVLAK